MPAIIRLFSVKKSHIRLSVILACLWIGCYTSFASAATNTDNKELTGDFIYKYLASEIAGQRGDFLTSGSIMYDLAKTERDAHLAEQAAKIAAYGNAPDLLVAAVKLWLELDASSTEAQQVMTEILLKKGDFHGLEPLLTQLLLKEENRANSFLYLNILFARSPDKAKVLKLVQSLAKPYRNMAEAQFAIAQAAYNAKKNETALAALDLAEELNPEWIAAALFKGQILSAQSPQAALDFYRGFLEQSPEATEVRLNMARILVNNKQYEAAKKEFAAVLNAAKNNPEIMTIIGLLSYQSGDYVAATRYFQQALDWGFKDSEQVYIYLGQTAEKQELDESALAWYGKVQKGPHYIEARINLANVIARAQSVDQAIEMLDSLEDMTAEQQIMIIQSEAALLGRNKRDQEAFDLLENAVKNLPNTPELVYDYALAADRLQKFDILETELRKAIAEKPDFAAAYNALGYSFADRNIRLNEAIKLIDKALAISPGDYFILDSLGWAYYRKGRLDKAIDYLRQAYAIGQDPEIAAHLGEALWKKGQHEEAQKIWEEALTAYPDNEMLIKTVNQFNP